MGSGANPRSKGAVLAGVLSLPLVFAGCGSSEPDSSGPIPMGKLPSVVVKSAQKELAGVAFESATVEKVSGKVTYEIKGKDKKGNARIVRVARDGKVLKTE